MYQVSSMTTDEYQSKGISIAKSELAKLYKHAEKLMGENSNLKKEMQFYAKHNSTGNGVCKALISWYKNDFT